MGIMCLDMHIVRYARTNVMVPGWQKSPVRLAASREAHRCRSGWWLASRLVCVGCCLRRPTFASIPLSAVADILAGVCEM